jgi:hypothetical protein
MRLFDTVCALRDLGRLSIAVRVFFTEAVSNRLAKRLLVLPRQALGFQSKGK